MGRIVVPTNAGTSGGSMSVQLLKSKAERLKLDSNESANLDDKSSQVIKVNRVAAALTKITLRKNSARRQAITLP